MGGADEILLWDADGLVQNAKLSVLKETFQVKEQLTNFPIDESQGLGQLFKTMVVVLQDESLIRQRIAQTLAEPRDLSWTFKADVDGGWQAQKAAAVLLKEKLAEVGLADSVAIQWAAEARSSFFALYGGLLFIGLFLGMLFLLATVLTIYYKQISEGIEDAGRFAIMTQVGMGVKEVKQTIHTQILLVFFLPLVVAAVHVLFAYPIMTKLLAILNMGNHRLFAFATGAVLILFGVLYGLVYSLTSRVYLRIVSAKN